jgi:hypothetical protein
MDLSRTPLDFTAALTLRKPPSPRRPSGRAGLDALVNTLVTRLASLAAATGCVVAALALPGPARADVGVPVQTSQPGVYGRIDLGRFPQPQVIVAQPVIAVKPPRHAAGAQPVYMWVPPGHRKNWSRHCSDYGACHVPVYFVRHDWYEQHVHPRRGGPPPHAKDGRGGPPPHAQDGREGPPPHSQAGRGGPPQR